LYNLESQVKTSGDPDLLGTTLALGSESSKVMLKEFQLDPVSRHLLHADFYRVAMDKPITVTVPVVLRGEAPGVKQQGGLLDFVHREIDIDLHPIFPSTSRSASRADAEPEHPPAGRHQDHGVDAGLDADLMLVHVAAQKPRRSRWLPRPGSGAGRRSLKERQKKEDETEAEARKVN
jgi:hypothetical protein